MNLSSTIVYFEESGDSNTTETLELALARAKERGIGAIVVASYTGRTGAAAARLCSKAGLRLVVVAGVVGFSKPNEHRLQPEYRSDIESRGGVVLHGTHAFGTLGRSVRKAFDSIQVDEIVAHVLRRFGQGLKVAAEISCMAADAGLIRTDEEVVAVGGTGAGADTAIVLVPANTHSFFDTKFLEIICKPRGG